MAQMKKSEFQDPENISVTLFNLTHQCARDISVNNFPITYLKINTTSLADFLNELDESDLTRISILNMIHKEHRPVMDKFLDSLENPRYGEFSEHSTYEESELNSPATYDDSSSEDERNVIFKN